jgi:general secretion pathway protein K
VQQTPPLQNNKGLSNNRGVALLIALFAMVLLTFIASEISYDARVEYVVSAQAVNRVKAYYAAKAAMELSLLRIMVYKQAAVALGSKSAAMLEPIWKFPFMWPPAAVGEKMTEVDKSMIKGAVEESLMEATYTTQIESEGGKLDINDLGSPVKALRESTKQIVKKIFENEMINNEDFKKKYGTERFDELVNNISDWIDEDKESQNGGDETHLYDKMPQPDSGSLSDIFPPNRPFRTLEELHMVAGMKDDFYKLLEPRVTVFGTMGISVNYAPKELLMSLDETMTSNVVDELIKMRNDPQHGPFKSADEFLQAVNGAGGRSANIEALKIPLLVGMEFNFRIRTAGVVANVKREITAVTYDYENLVDALAKSLDDQDKTTDPNNPPPNPPPSGTADPAEPALKGPKGRPKVVYWEEN